MAEQEEHVVEPTTGISFPKKLSDGKLLATTGIGKSYVLGTIPEKMSAFGLYTDDVALAEVLKENNIATTVDAAAAGNAPIPRELYEVVIDSDAGMTLRLVISSISLTMNDLRVSFNEGLGGVMKKLAGLSDQDLLNEVKGGLIEDLNLPPMSTIEITRLPGQILQTKVKGKVVSTVKSELLCRTYFYLYLGDDPIDKQAKKQLGEHLLKLIA